MLTPQDVAIAGRLLAEQWEMNLDYFVDYVAELARVKYAGNDEESYKATSSLEYLNRHGKRTSWTAFWPRKVAAVYAMRPFEALRGYPCLN